MYQNGFYRENDNRFISGNCRSDRIAVMDYENFKRSTLAEPISDIRFSETVFYEQFSTDM
jgi:hypothetical protein